MNALLLSPSSNSCQSEDVFWRFKDLLELDRQPLHSISNTCNLGRANVSWILKLDLFNEFAVGNYTDLLAINLLILI